MIQHTAQRKSLLLCNETLYYSDVFASFKHSIELFQIQCYRKRFICKTINKWWSYASNSFRVGILRNMDNLPIIWVEQVRFEKGNLYERNVDKIDNLRYVPEGNMTACGTDYITKDWVSRSYLLAYSLACYYSPLFLIIYSYWFIVQVSEIIICTSDIEVIYLM